MDYLKLWLTDIGQLRYAEEFGRSYYAIDAGARFEGAYAGKIELVGLEDGERFPIDKFTVALTCPADNSEGCPEHIACTGLSGTTNSETRVFITVSVGEWMLRTLAEGGYKGCPTLIIELDAIQTGAAPDYLPTWELSESHMTKSNSLRLHFDTQSFNTPTRESTPDGTRTDILAALKSLSEQLATFTTTASWGLALIAAAIFLSRIFH